MSPSIHDWERAALEGSIRSKRRRLDTATRPRTRSLLLGTIGLVILLGTAAGWILWAVGAFR